MVTEGTSRRRSLAYPHAHVTNRVTHWFSTGKEHDMARNSRGRGQWRISSLQVTSVAAIALLAACGQDSTTSTEVDPNQATAGRGPAGTTGSTPSGAGSATTAGRCNGVLGAITVSDVFVPAGATCDLQGTRVRGNVIVSRDAALLAAGARIDGNVQGEDARAMSLSAGTTVNGSVQAKRRAVVRLNGVTVGGNVQIEETGASLVAEAIRVTGNVQVAKADAADLLRVTTGGDIQFTENRASLRSREAQVEGNFQVEKNRGGVLLEANRVRQVLECKENTPAPTGAGNVAGEKKEQCRAL